MWSDNETTIDLLGFQHLVTGVLNIVRRDDLLPATIGVYGDWGSGKSSLLQLVQAELKSDKDILVLPFNGWLFEGQEDAKTALMGTILEEIGKREGLPSKAAGLVRTLLKRVNVMQLMLAGGQAALAYMTGGLPALGLSAGVSFATTASQLAQKASEADPEKVAKMIKDEAPAESARQSIREFRDDFKQLLKETNLKTLVVVIDDLDRCTPDTIIETLEAIKLFLFVPNTAFILGADERLVKYAVRRRFPELPGERAEVGRDYLEKLVQFPVRVPPLGRAEIETYINLLFAKRASLSPADFEKSREKAVNCDPMTLLAVRFNYGVAKDVLHVVPPELEESLAMAERIAPVLATGLSGNPRQCKRFLNMLVMRFDMAASRKVTLLQRVLAKLMLLEYFRPETFRRLAELQGAQQGKPSELAHAEQVVRAVPDGGSSVDKSQGATPERSVGRSAEQTSSSVDIAAWLADDWIKEWLKSDPALADVDLHPYFFFSRDTLGPLGGAVQRMSPAAQEKLSALFHESEAVRQNAVKQAASLNPADAAAVFESLSERARREDDPNVPTAALTRLCEWTGERAELVGQLVTFLKSFPETQLPPSIVPRLLKLGTLGPEQDRLVRQLVEKWARTSSNLKLRGAADRILKSRSQS